MSYHPTLLEPSFADLIAAIDKASDLDATKRNHWICSVGRIAAALDKPEIAIPARWISVRRSVEALHHAQLGVTNKTLANHRANLRAALNWFCREHDISPRGVALTEDWQALWMQLEGVRPRANLSSLMRYCSAYLASAVLQHTDPRVTQAHYNRATSLSAGKTFQEIVSGYRK